MDKKAHWEKIYATKSNDEVSWHQPLPKDSLDLITNSGIGLDDPIIDVGAGNSFLVDHLLKKGFTNITVLDISKNAINKAKNRLGEKAELVNWVVTDILDFKSLITYKIWHDRAVFHFIRDEEEIEKYKKILEAVTDIDTHMVLATFSENGPDKCSGIQIKKYSTADLQTNFKNWEMLSSYRKIHSTPFNTTQEFTFFYARKKSS